MTTDLRLVPAALAAWAAAWVLTSGATPGGAPAWALAAMAAATLLLALASAASGRALRAGSSRAAHDPARSGRPGGVTVRALAAHGVLVLCVVLGVALSVQVHDAGRAVVEGLASQRAHAVLTGRVVADARPGAFGAGSTWALDADTVTARAATSRVHARVEVTSATAPPYGARARVEVDLRPAEPGAAEAAQAEATRSDVVRAPPLALRATNAMRAALLDVTGDLSPQAQGLVPGIAVGDTSRLPDDLADAFKVTGLTHLTAVSGGHFAIVLALVTGLVGMLRAPRWVRLVLVAVVAAAFVLLVRPEGSVLRAAAMCAVTLAGIALGRPAASVPSLATCTAVLLTCDPWLSRSFGFALSCAATAGLVLLAPPLMRRLVPWTGRPAAFALAVPVAAQLACGPVLVLLSASLPTTSVLANLLAAPAVAPATLLGLAATVTAPWAGPVAHVLAWLAGCATWWVAAVARWCASLPGARLPWPGGARGALLLLAATAALLLLVLRRPPGAGWPVAWSDGGRRKVLAVAQDTRATAARFRRGIASRRDRGLALVALAAALLLAAGTTTALVRFTPAGGDMPGDWQVVACDVGQGDSLAVRTGPASAIVIDVGPEGDASGRCLDRLGVKHIDLLVLSHEHLDHVGGLAPALAGRTVGAAWISPLDQPAANSRRVRSELDDIGVTPRVPVVGEQGTAGQGGWSVDVEVLGTGIASAGGAAMSHGTVSSDSAEGDGINDSSLALALTSHGPGGTLEIAALGDLEEDGQDALLASLRRATAGAAKGVADGVDVVKVAHHGSASQSDGLAQMLHPRIALVSVGKGNTYGHPTDRMLDLYAGLGSQVVRTDECGSAVLVVRGGKAGLACVR